MIEGSADVHGVAHGADGAPEEEAVGDGVEALGGLEELEVALAHAGPDLFEIGGHLFGVVLEVEDLPVLEEAAPLRREPDHGYVVFQVTICLLREDFAEHGGLDEDGWPHVEAEVRTR